MNIQSLNTVTILDIYSLSLQTDIIITVKDIIYISMIN